MCTGGGSVEKKLRIIIKLKFYILCAVVITVAATTPYYETIISPKHPKVPGLNLVPIIAPFWNFSKIYCSCELCNCEFICYLCRHQDMLKIIIDVLYQEMNSIRALFTL